MFPDLPERGATDGKTGVNHRCVGPFSVLGLIDWAVMTSSAEQTTAAPPMNKTLIYVSLGLALALVVGVLVGSKVVMQKLNNQPVSLSELPSPMADSAECAQLVESLPDELAGHRRAELLDPAPAGAAVWQSTSDERVTLRCGVEAPLHYTELTPTFEAAGARWIEISDPTAGADLSTWFTVDRSPVVAVTADHQAVREGESPVDKLDLSALPEEASEPAPRRWPGLNPQRAL